MNQFLDFHGVSFSFDGLSLPLFSDLSVRMGRGWTGIVGANGSGKTTFLQLASGAYEPDVGTVQCPSPFVYCAQRTDEPPALLTTFTEAMDGRAWELRGKLGVAYDWLDRWQTLSHGERKRAQIAAALWANPAVLAIDEPSNHIDTQARAMLLDALASFRGIGLLVSHDRHFLDTLCHQCLFLQPPDATLRPGGYSQGAEQAKADHQRLVKQRQQIRTEVKRLKQESDRRRTSTASEHKNRSKRGVGKHDADSRAKINLARLTDSKAGASLNQIKGRQAKAQQQLDASFVRKEASLGIWLAEAKSQMDFLFRVSTTTIPFGDAFTSEAGLAIPDLAMKPDDRVGLVGPNGAGKSTLIDYLTKQLSIAEHQLLYMPQEVTAMQSVEILKQVRQCSGEKLGQLMNVVSCLGSDPQRLLETDMPSPGELRKLLLALGVVNAVSLIIMDEPTNHLDLPSTECLEQALSVCPCALLLVSHDQRFLQTLTTTYWSIEREAEHGASQLRVHQQW
ncbi:MAG: ATP-binding cassette domain-containing protein [Phycisphaeraceae bacterium JB051]